MVTPVDRERFTVAVEAADGAVVLAPAAELGHDPARAPRSGG
ncbi:hypothetical protein ACFWB1_12325 [Streptomyces goshikiensis]|nr:hypothetical protein [Streptomyces sp. CJ_13]